MKTNKCYEEIAFFLFVLFITSGARAQLANVIPSPTAIAHTSVSNTDTWSAFQNPAMLGYISSAEIGLQYGNRSLVRCVNPANTESVL